MACLRPPKTESIPHTAFVIMNPVSWYDKLPGDFFGGFSFDKLMNSKVSKSLNSQVSTTETCDFWGVMTLKHSYLCYLRSKWNTFWHTKSPHIRIAVLTGTVHLKTKTDGHKALLDRLLPISCNCWELGHICAAVSLRFIGLFSWNLVGTLITRSAFKVWNVKHADMTLTFHKVKTHFYW